MIRATRQFTRRAALRRLGLGLGAAYCSPILTGLSRAHAASSASAASSATPPSPPSDPSAPTRPSPPSSSSAPSGSENNRGSDRDARNETQGGCSAPSGSERIEISRRDMETANQAVERGEAKPLREIFQTVQTRHPGQVIRVGFNSSGASREYWLQMVTGSGSVQTVTVDALTGAILNVRGC